MPTERRAAPRRDVFRLGELMTDMSAAPIDCLVRNSSEIGALIEVKATEGLPTEFHLSVASTGITKRCRVTRQTKHLLGVVFTN